MSEVPVVGATASKRLIVAAVVGAGAVAAARDIAAGRPPRIQTAVGVWIAGTMLALLAEGAPELAGPLAILLFTAAVMSEDSEQLINRIAKLVQPGGDKRAASSSRSAPQRGRTATKVR